MRNPFRQVVVASLVLTITSACTTLDDARVDTIRQAQTLYHKKLPEKAIKTLEHYLASDVIDIDHRVQALTLVGDIHYSTQQFELAARAYRSAQQLQPDNLDLVTRSWKVRLLVSPRKQSKESVRQEITSLTEDRDDVDAVLTAYQGFSYLWDATGRKRMLDKLISTPLDDAGRRVLPGMLMEEMLQSESRGDIFNYGNFFIRHFINHANAPTVIDYLFRVASSRDQLAFAGSNARDPYPDNPYLAFHLARLDLSTPAPGNQAKRKLAELSTRASTGTLDDCKHAGTRETCRYFSRKLAANIQTLQASLLMEQGRKAEALDLLDQVTTPGNDPAAWRLKSRLLLDNGRTRGALNAVVHSLNRQPGSKDGADLFNKIRKHPDVQGRAKSGIAVKQGIPYFKDVTNASGLNTIAARRAAWGDVNGDGYDDLLLSGPRLLLNRGGKSFEDITSRSGLQASRDTSGGLFIDFDNDGLLDVLTTGRHTVLYRNIGATRFRVFKRFNKNTNTRTAAAAWGDANNDGFPDLYLANYERPGPHRGLCSPDQLFINERGKHFVDHGAVLQRLNPYPLCGRGVSWSDLDQDGSQEIIVSNYRLQPNSLLHGITGSTPSDIATSSHYQVDKPGHSIGTVSADLDGDGKPDLFQTNLAHPRYLHASDVSRLLINNSTNSDVVFKTRIDSGIGFSETHADVSAADFDNDGDLDLYVTATYPGRYSSLLLNQGNGYFQDASWLSNSQVENAWGVASADYDNDGDTDLLVASENGIRLLNNQGQGNAGLKVVVRSKNCQKQGVGTKLWLTAGEHVSYREIQAGKGTGTQDSIHILFGLSTFRDTLELRAKDICGFEYTRTIPAGIFQVTIP